MPAILNFEDFTPEELNGIFDDEFPLEDVSLLNKPKESPDEDEKDRRDRGKSLRAKYKAVPDVPVPGLSRNPAQYEPGEGMTYSPHHPENLKPEPRKMPKPPQVKPREPEQVEAPPPPEPPPPAKPPEPPDTNPVPKKRRLEAKGGYVAAHAEEIAGAFDRLLEYTNSNAQNMMGNNVNRQQAILNMIAVRAEGLRRAVESGDVNKVMKQLNSIIDWKPSRVFEAYGTRWQDEGRQMIRDIKEQARNLANRMSEGSSRTAMLEEARGIAEDVKETVGPEAYEAYFRPAFGRGFRRFTAGSPQSLITALGKIKHEIDSGSRALGDLPDVPDLANRINSLLTRLGVMKVRNEFPSLAPIAESLSQLFGPLAGSQYYGPRSDPYHVDYWTHSDTAEEHDLPLYLMIWPAPEEEIHGGVVKDKIRDAGVPEETVENITTGVTSFGSQQRIWFIIPGAYLGQRNKSLPRNIKSLREKYS